MGLQVHGGMGFIEETGAAQHYRDVRILPIYEGTNGIQAIDLMGRKLAIGKGRAVRELVSDIVETAAALKSADDAWLHTIGARLEAGLAAVQSATGWLIERRGHAQPDALAGATPYLKLLGDVVGGWMLAKGAMAASEKIAAGEGDASYWRTKIGLARVYSEQILLPPPQPSQPPSARARSTCSAPRRRAWEPRSYGTAHALRRRHHGPPPHPRLRARPVPRALIEKINGLAMRAPSSMNTQPWNFYVITGEPLDRIRAGNTVLISISRAGLRKSPRLPRPSAC